MPVFVSVMHRQITHQLEFLRSFWTPAGRVLPNLKRAFRLVNRYETIEVRRLVARQNHQQISKIPGSRKNVVVQFLSQF